MHCKRQPALPLYVPYSFAIPAYQVPDNRANVQSILTGESGSVEKETAAVKDPRAVYQDKTCLMFSVRHSHAVSFA